MGSYKASFKCHLTFFFFAGTRDRSAARGDRDGGRVHHHLPVPAGATAAPTGRERAAAADRVT